MRAAVIPLPKRRPPRFDALELDFDFGQWRIRLYERGRVRGGLFFETRREAREAAVNLLWQGLRRRRSQREGA